MEVAASNMTNPTGEEILQYLLDAGEASQAKVQWGKSGYRNVVIFQGKKYLYKGTGKINKRLLKSILPLYINMSEKPLNKNTKNSANAISKIKKWVKQNSHNFKQENHTIQIVYEVTTRNVDSEETKTKSFNTKAFDVYGGKVTIRKAIERKNQEIKELFENDYNVVLEDMKIKRIYIDDVKMDATTFKDIKMFGTLLNICGYDLNVGTYEFVDACCLEYHLEMFNKFRDNKWTIERLMAELGMTSIDEGITLNQLIPLYMKYKIGYHVVDFKYHVTASHNEHNYTPTRNYPALFYMIDNNHLYPIVNRQHQKSIAQIKDIAHKKTFKPKEEKPQKRTFHVFNRPLVILAMLGHEKSDDVELFDAEQCKNDVFVCTTPSVVHDLFYHLLKMNLLYNKNVRTDNTIIIQFYINNMTIQENTDYREVVSTIDILNKDIVSDKDKYFYHGQSIHRLAFEYYEQNHNKEYKSELSPQVADIFNDKSSKNTAFNITLKDVQATDAYDFNKLYSSILQFCGDKFGWCSYLPTDCIKPYDENIKTGFYYVETNVLFPCRGNGWYADIFVCEALNLRLITHDDIKYQIKSSRMLSPRFFQDFVNAIVKSFANYKKANNGFI